MIRIYWDWKINKLETMASDVVSPNANGETVNETAEPETEETATPEPDATF